MVNTNLYTLRDCTGKEYQVHSQRIKYYCTKEDLKLTETVKKVYIHNRGQFHIKSIINVAFYEQEYLFECKWHGLEDDYTTWESLKSLMDEVPDMVMKFLKENADKSVSAKFLLNQYLPNSQEDSRSK